MKVRLAICILLTAAAADARPMTVCDLLVKMPKLIQANKLNGLSVRGIWVIEDKKEFLLAEKPCGPRPTTGLYLRPESIELGSTGGPGDRDLTPGGLMRPSEPDPWHDPTNPFPGHDNNPFPRNPNIHPAWHDPYRAPYRAGKKNIIVVHGNLGFTRACGLADQPLVLCLSYESARSEGVRPYTKDDLERIQNESAAAKNTTCGPARPEAMKRDK